MMKDWTEYETFICKKAFEYECQQINTEGNEENPYFEEMKRLSDGMLLRECVEFAVLMKYGE